MGENPKPQFVPQPKPQAASPAVVAPSTVPPKPIIDEAAVRAKLEEVGAKIKIRGNLIYPPPEMDFTEFEFDARHTQGDEHPHDVTEEEARRFIREAYFVLVRYNGNSYNYYGKEGAAFARTDLKTIRTAFKAEEYDKEIKSMPEAYENELRRQGVLPAD